MIWVKWNVFLFFGCLFFFLVLISRIQLPTATCFITQNEMRKMCCWWPFCGKFTRAIISSSFFFYCIFSVVFISVFLSPRQRFETKQAEPRWPRARIGCVDVGLIFSHFVRLSFRSSRISAKLVIGTVRIFNRKETENGTQATRNKKHQSVAVAFKWS